MPEVGPVGRDRELAQVEAFLDASQVGAWGLALTGPAGIGKSTVWAEGVRRARDQSWTLLAARPSGAEARLSYAGLADLLAGVDELAFGALPAAQRRALDVALVREQLDGDRLDDRAVFAGMLSVLRVEAASAPVLLAVDDAQWLDRPSASALAYVLRRLEDGVVVRVLVSVRVYEDRPDTFERVLPVGRRTEVELDGLSVGALHEVMKRELGRVVSRPTLVRIAEASGGNPFYALEIVRALDPSGATGPDSLLPVPGSMQTLTRSRLAGLPADTREALLRAACLSRPTADLVAIEPLAAAEEAGIVTVDATGRIRFTHPLLAAAVYDSAPAARKRRVHNNLVQHLKDPEERARHLALSAGGPDTEISRVLDAASERAAARGAPAAAAELCELALRLTPPGDGQRLRRLIDLGNLLFTAGDIPAAIAALETAVDQAPPGRERSRARVDLGGLYGLVGRHSEGLALIDEGLAGLDDPLEAARAHSRRAAASWQDLPSVIEHSRATLELVAEQDAPALYSSALEQLALARLFAGEAAEHELMERSLAAQRRAGWGGASSFSARWASYFDDLILARDRWRECLSRAGSLGDESERQEALFGLTYLELWLGHPDEAGRLAREALALGEQIGQEPMVCVARSALGFVEAHCGRIESARELGLATVAFVGSPPPPEAFVLAAQACSLLGFAAFSCGELEEANRWYTSADTALRPWPDPAPFRFHGDHAEVVITLGDSERAEQLVARLERRAELIPRPWVCAIAARARGLLLSAAGDLDASLAAMNESLDQQARSEMPFERARTLLGLGQLLRRRRERRTARTTLQEALDLFEHVGAPLWAKRAQTELGRVPVRRAQADLTPTEATIANLAATGLTNRAIAERIFVSPKTVEGNLARVYKKLGIHSRAELGRAMTERQHGLNT